MIFSPTANKWKSFFSTLPANNDADRNLASFSEGTAADENNIEPCLFQSLVEAPNVLIVSVAPGTGNIKLLHSGTNLGGKRVRPSNKIVPPPWKGLSP